MNYDVRIKAILQGSMPRLFRLLGLPPLSEYLTVEFPLHQKVVSDWVVRLVDGRILHIELQSKNDSRMLYRCLNYWGAMVELWPTVEIVQVVIYLGDSPMTMVARLDNNRNHFEFDVLSLKDVEAAEFLGSDEPAERILAVLCHSEDPRATIREILASWKLLPAGQIVDNINDLALLSQLRKQDTIVKEESLDMPIEIDITENAFYKAAAVLGEARGHAIGEARGEAIGEIKGEARALTAILLRRFGPLPALFRSKIEAATIDELDRWIEHVIDAPTLDAVFRD